MRWWLLGSLAPRPATLDSRTGAGMSSFKVVGSESARLKMELSVSTSRSATPSLASVMRSALLSKTCWLRLTDVDLSARMASIPWRTTLLYMMSAMVATWRMAQSSMTPRLWRHNCIQEAGLREAQQLQDAQAVPQWRDQVRKQEDGWVLDWMCFASFTSPLRLPAGMWLSPQTCFLGCFNVHPALLQQQMVHHCFCHICSPVFSRHYHSYLFYGIIMAAMCMKLMVNA